MVRKNDTKRKEQVFFHPYIRRRRSNTPPSPSDTAFKDKLPAAAEAGEPEKKVPLTLYNSIQQALGARKVWEAKRTKTSELELVFAENFVNNIAECYKRKKLLPLSWKYNPATASTHEPKDDFPLMQWLNGEPMRSEDGVCICIESTKPEVNFVPLKDYETESWLEFKKLDEGNFSSIPGEGWGLKFPLSTKHPFVSVIGDFAVNGFNQAFEMYVEKGNHNRLIDPIYKKCTYCKMDRLYEFEMTIVCNEDGFRGIYEALVTCTVDDCKKTLSRLDLTGVKHGKIRRATKFKSSIGVRLRLPDVQGTGMWLRYPLYGMSYGCYNYVDPSDIVG